MHRSIAGNNPYYLFILTKDYSKNLTTSSLLTKEHMPMFVIKSIVIQINDLGYWSINCASFSFIKCEIEGLTRSILLKTVSFALYSDQQN